MASIDDRILSRATSRQARFESSILSLCVSPLLLVLVNSEHILVGAGRLSSFPREVHEKACQTPTWWDPNLNPTPTSVPPHPPAMDTFEALRDQVSKITIYDIKSMYNQVRLISSIHPIASTHLSVGEEYGPQRQRDGGKSPRGYK